MKHDVRHRTVSILGPAGAAVLRVALERLRSSGLSRSEAGAELVRQSLSDWMETERAEQSPGVGRLRIVKS